jgi:adenylosuccinate synthase
MVVGAQWGDEGKGKIVDLLAGGFPAVVRYNGGHNAGHTVKFEDKHFALHLVPSGIINPRARCYMGAGMVIDPMALVTELDGLAAGGVTIGDRLMLSPRATLILPTHCALDAAREGALGTKKIGTTGRGIGPAYQDQAQRRGLRTHLLADRDRFEERARALMGQHNVELQRVFDAPPVDLDEAMDRLKAAADRVAPMLGDPGPEIRALHDAGRPILFEGAQGVLLDITWGTYPFVTSSSCLPAGAAASCGIGVGLLGPVLGVMKAYVTRVGGGPFPTEDHGEVGEHLREAGCEFGTTTGRPRRCGWFDAVAARYAVDVAGIDAIALMKLDVLDGMEELRIATAYTDPEGRVVTTLPAESEDVEGLTPVYETVPGWSASTVGATAEDALPRQALEYLKRLETLLGVPIVVVSTGPRREETMTRGEGPVADLLRARFA